MNNFLIVKILLTMIPIIIAGILNMIFVKSPLCSALKAPIDRGHICGDGKPLLGPNKTWKGAFGMIAFSAFAMLLFHAALGDKFSEWTLYRTTPRVWLSSLTDGALLGLAYIVFELPNSFIKRRLDIGAGANATGLRGLIFTVIDQADSVLGCALVLLFITSISVGTAALLVVIGAGIHLLVNALLYLGGLKKQAR